MMKKWLILLKSISNSRLECTIHTLFQTKTAENHTAAHTLIRDYPPPPGGEKFVSDYESQYLRKRA